MKHDIFISYSRKDTAIVDQFVNRLTEAGYRVWIDREGIYSGDQFATSIVEAIENSKILLFFSSANSNASEWTVREIYYALSEHKTIIPIKIDTAKYDKRVALNLILVDFIQYQKNDFSSAARRLIASVAKHLREDHSSTITSFSTTNNLAPSITQSVEQFSKESIAEEDLSAEEYYQKGLKHGRKATKKGYQEAIKWFRKAAEQGHANAAYNLSIYYELGYGVKKDIHESTMWCLKAAELGHVIAQRDMGFNYESGRGVPVDNQEAIKWLRLAAEQGNEDAILFLGQMYGIYLD